MTYEELMVFKENVAEPRMKKIIEETKVPEGTCYLNNLDVSFLDGRSCGFDSRIEAEGLLYKNGRVHEYHYEEMDVTVEEFVKEHANCRFISDAKFTFYDELEEMKIQTVVRTSSHLARIYPDLAAIRELPMDLTSYEWIKMKFLFENGVEEKKKSLDEQITHVSNGKNSSKKKQAFVCLNMESSKKLGVSYEEYKDKMVDYCEKKGYIPLTVFAVPAHDYVEVPSLKDNIMKSVKKNLIDAVVVQDLSLLGTDEVRGGEFHQMLKKSGIEVKVIDDSMVFDKDKGKGLDTGMDR